MPRKAKTPGGGNGKTEDEKRFAETKRGVKPITATMKNTMLLVNISDLTKLNLRKQKFVAVYCSNNFDSKNAVLQAGYQPKTYTGLLTQARKLLAEEQVQEAIRRHMIMLINPFRERMEYMITEVYFRRAFYRVDMFFDKDGNTKPLDEIDQEWMVVIDGVEKKFYGKDADRKTISYKLANRDVALQHLSSMVEMASGKNVDMLGELPSEARGRVSAIFNEKFGHIESSLSKKHVKKPRGRPRKKAEFTRLK